MRQGRGGRTRRGGSELSTSPLRAALLAVALGACTQSAQPPAPWKAGLALPSPTSPDLRGMIDRRGILHAHSVYSHDACDDAPMPGGVPDEACLADLRDGVCSVKHDFLLLTDHNGSFAEHEFPDVLLYRPEKGDVLVERAGGPVASRLSCGGGRSVLVLAGTESASMPVGLEGHVAATPAERSAVYQAKDAAAIGKLKAQGAVALAQHTETWTVDELSTLPLDGFEMYNLHANTFYAADVALSLWGRVKAADATLPSPDLVFLELFRENDIYLNPWGSTLARGVKRVTVLATDSHRNSFPDKMADGERIDGYRRMMSWFSNHLLVRAEADGSWDDRHLKEALRAGRLYGVFEAMGFASGFDYHAEAGGGLSEMGAEVALSDAPRLVVKKPSLVRLDPSRMAPELKLRLLRARDGGFDEVASGAGDLSFAPALPGAYRAEVRMVPLHLREDLGGDADKVLDGVHDRVWIYSNAIYVK